VKPYFDRKYHDRFDKIREWRRMRDTAAAAKVARPTLEEWEKAADFYLRCKADPKSTEVGAMRDAIEWFSRLSERATRGAGK
jgi:diadenosine tetraphosphatase ApaH/serine/threonine PP2A family protein phosphatase